MEHGKVHTTAATHKMRNGRRPQPSHATAHAYYGLVPHTSRCATDAIARNKNEIATRGNDDEDDVHTDIQPCLSGAQPHTSVETTPTRARTAAHRPTAALQARTTTFVM